MKKKLITFIALLAMFSAVAQKGLPGFGKIDKADLEMRDCDFDKGAEAVKLIDWGNLYYDRGTVGVSLFKTIFERRVRIKILKQKGLSYANVKIPYYGRNDNEKMLTLDACTYNLDASGNVQVTEVKKSSIYSKRIDQNRFEMIITFPEVKPGSVIEYRYRMDRETYDLRNWVFQDAIPVRYSEYDLKVPKIFRFTVKPTVVDSIDIKNDVVEERISVERGIVRTESVKSSYIMQKLPGIRNEPYMSAVTDYVQRLEFQLSQLDYGDGRIRDLRVKWSDVIEDLLKNDDFGKQLEADIPGTESIITEARTLPDTASRIQFLHNTVRDMMNWNKDDDFMTDAGISKAFSMKTGNTADINLLLVHLLNDAGIPAKPILFSTRDNGLVNTYYPFSEQFNTVMAFVQAGDKKYVLDATDKAASWLLPPERVVNTNGFIVEGPNGTWMEYSDNGYKYKLMVAVKGEISNDGSMKGDAVVDSRDYSRRQRVEDWRKDKDAFKRIYFTIAGIPVKTDEVTISNLDADSLPLEQRVLFTTQLSSSGNYRYFNINIFSEMDKNEFVKDERISDVDYGVLQDYAIFGNFILPEGYVFDELPKDKSILMPDNSIIFSRNIQADGNLLNVRISIEYKNSLYPAAQYPEFREFHKKMFAALNEQIVIKKKP